LPDEPAWYIDGQILDEDYVYASFLQSKMYEREVQCNDCHNVHSTQLLFEGNDLCLQCHQAETYDNYNHHFHKKAGMPGEPVISESGVTFEVGSGTECINCHMHGRYYMGVDYRRDHSFRIPRPDLSIKHGTPNACNQCHINESNQWADNYITRWFGESRRYHYSEALAGAKNQKPGALDELAAILENELYPPNIRSLALEKIGIYYQDSVSDLSEKYINHLNPSFRLSSIRSMHAPSERNIPILLNSLKDDIKAVRCEAVQRLMQIGEDRIPDDYLELYQIVLKEYEQVLFFNADFPTGKVNLGNFYSRQNKLHLAEKYYLSALEQDNELYYIKLNLAYLYNRLNQNEKAEKLFRDYLKQEPEDAETLYSLGLLLTEMGKYKESLSTLLNVVEMTPERPRVNHNIAMMYDFMKDKEKAEEYLKKEIEATADLNSHMELMKFYIDNNQLEKALEYGNKILEEYPEAGQVKQAVEAISNRL
ncbi:MAG: tetratricopeptide repeat protein, partial [Bacteroidota bacterium]